MKFNGLWKLMALLVMLSMLLGACSTSATEAPEEPAPTDVPEEPAATDAPEEPDVDEEEMEEVSLEIWWWGCQNVPEYETYFEDSIALYEEMNPHITIEQL